MKISRAREPEKEEKIDRKNEGSKWDLFFFFHSRFITPYRDTFRFL